MPPRKSKPRTPVTASFDLNDAPNASDLRTRCHHFRTRHDCGDHWIEFLELFMSTVLDIQQQLDALAAKIAAIPPAVVPVATQADLDAISAQITTITAAVPA